jgi:ferrochelatase|nr:MAG: ferrochelatase [Bacteroidota bacterium]
MPYVFRRVPRPPVRERTLPMGPIPRPGERIAVVLLNMGGPDSLEAVEPFLFNLFSDTNIISMGPVDRYPRLRRAIARLIARTRAISVRKKYAQIGGRSPITPLSELQARALEERLNATWGDRYRFRTYLCWRYWHPFSWEVVEALRREGTDRVVLLPLYPQYSRTTTGSSFRDWFEQTVRRNGGRALWPTHVVISYPDHPAFVAAISARMDETLQKDLPPEARSGVHYVFSAHGTPLSDVRRGDPYSHQVRATVEAVMRLRGYDRPYHLAFQSKVGPARWLEPSTPDTIHRLARSGVQSVLVVPVAFVTDHIETSHELDIEIRAEAERAGIRHYVVMRALNDHPHFIEALAEQVEGLLHLTAEARREVDDVRGSKTA